MCPRKPRKSRTAKAPRPARKSRVSKFPPEADAARDEGPRLIPLPNVDAAPPRRGGDPGGLPTNRYVALADLALRLWNSKPDSQSGDSPKPQPSPPRRSKR